MKKILLLAIVLGLAWWLLSPLFINKTVKEELPTSKTHVESLMTDGNLTEQLEPEQMKEYEEMLKHIPEDVVMYDDTNDAPEVFSTGNIVSVAHKGSGTATIYAWTPSQNFLRFESLDVLNGPDLRVLLSKERSVTRSSELGEYIELGKLSGNKGDQNYLIPEGVELSEYKTAVIYCKPFGVVFNVAQLN